MEAPTLAILAQATEPSSNPIQGARQVFLDSMGYQAGATLVTVALLFAAGILIQILSGWIAAKAVIGNELCTLANTVKLWLLSLVASIGVVILMGILLPVVAMTRNDLASLVILCGGMLLLFSLAFLLPMKVFDTNFIRTLGFIIVSFVLMVAGNTGLDHAMGLPMFGRWEELAMHFKRVAHPSTHPIDLELERLENPRERKRPVTERQARLKKLYSMLETRQKELPPGDRTALGEYDQQRTRYEALLKVLKNDVAAQPPPAAAP